MKNYHEKRFSDEELEMANKSDLLDLVSSYGLTVVPFSRSTFTTKEHDSLKITPGSGFVWHSRSIKGGPIQLKMCLGNLTWVEAVKELLNIDDIHAVRKSYTPPIKVEEKKDFVLPKKSDTYKHLFAYLLNSRGINKDVLNDFVKSKCVYESVYEDSSKGYKFFNCTFVGKDKQGTPRYAATRSTNTNVSFKGEVEGSNKEYAFSKVGIDGSIFTYESPIELMSFMSLLKNNGVDSFNSHLVATGGLSLMALDKYIHDYSTDFEFKKIFVCTNNDEAGHNAYLNTFEVYSEKYEVLRIKPNDFDWNNDLTKSLEIETRHKEFKLPVLEIPKYDIINSYLLDTLKIDKDLIEFLIGEKLLQQTLFGNCAFVSRDSNGYDKSAYIMSTNSFGEKFENHVEGSDTKYSFSLKGKNSTLSIFKDPIEMLSYITLAKRYGKEFSNNCMAYTNNPSSIAHYLESNLSIKKIIFCGNHDVKNEIAKVIKDEDISKYEFNLHMPNGSSFNEDSIDFVKENSVECEV